MQSINKDFEMLEMDKRKIDQLIDDVLSQIDPNWPTIYKIRYIYLGIGKYLYKDVDFFFSADDKLGEANLSLSEIKNIYNSESGRFVRNKLKVICKSASFILKMAYDKAGIPSELVETNTAATVTLDEEEFIINHWFLSIHDTEQDKFYFATLIPDLPYIQMNMNTRHFGVNISYKKEYTGEVLQVYKGDEIHHSVLSKEELKKIDIAIGYINHNYHYNDNTQPTNDWFLQYDDASLYILRDSLRDNKLFYELEIAETDFYQSLMDFHGEHNQRLSFIDNDVNSFSEKDWECWIKIICSYVLEKIQNVIGYEINVLPKLDSKYWNYDAWILNLCVQIEELVYKQLDVNLKDDFDNLVIDVENFQYNKWSKQLKAKFGKKIKRFDSNNLLLILDKMNAIVACVNSKRKNGNLRDLVTSLAFHFIDETHLYENNILEDGSLSNYYIANKFDKIFRKIFQCNDTVTEFNNMGYGEKVTIIKEILVMMFPEINRNNSSMLKEYNPQYGAVLNRIQLYPIKNKKDGYFSILFHILGDNESGDYYFLYNAKKNTFDISNALDVYNDYIIISNRMKQRMSVEELDTLTEYPHKEKRR